MSGPSGIDRVLLVDANNNPLSLAAGSLQARKPFEWYERNTPAANTKATIFHAAEAGKIHVVTALYAQYCSTAVIAGGDQRQIILYDGASGSPTVVISVRPILGAVIGALWQLTLPNLHIPMTLGNAATWEFTNAGVANTLQDVAMTGYTYTP